MTRNFTSTFLAVFVGLGLSAGARAETIVFYDGASIPELGISSYDGLKDVRLNNKAYGPGDGNGGAASRLFVGHAHAINEGLMGFDLDCMAGWKATGNATLQLTVYEERTGDGEYFDLYRLWPTNANWIEGEHSVGNPPSDGEPTWNHRAHPSTDWVGAVGTGDYPGLGNPGDGYELLPIDSIYDDDYVDDQVVTFTIPQATMQDMLDGNNAGLLLVHRDLGNGSREMFFKSRSYGSSGPTLTVQAVVPEPATWMFLILGGLSLVVLRRRRTRRAG